MDTNDENAVSNLWTEALSSFNAKMWQNSIRHCEQIIQNDWRKHMGNFSVQDIPPIIVSLIGSDSDIDISDSDSPVENEAERRPEDTANNETIS